MTAGRAPRPLRWLGALLVLYLAYPVGAFAVRVITGHDEGWSTAGLWSSLQISVEGASLSLLIGVVLGVPLAYVLSRHRGWLSSLVGVVVQLPLAVPPLISGILLVYIVGPYTFLGHLSGERLTQTFYGVVIAQSFVSAPFLVVVARSAFAAVDPSLDDVAATLGHRPLARFLRVDVPAASDGLRTGMILMWLRAFGEYGTTVVLAYHPYSLPIYVDNLFSSAPLSQAEAPTLLAFAVAALAIVAGRLHGPRHARLEGRPPVAGAAPSPRSPAPVGFDLHARVGTFELSVSHRADSHRLAIVGPSGSGKSLTLRALAGLLGPGVGTVTLAGHDVSAARADERSVGYVPQGFGLLPGQTVWRQANFGVGADPARASWWLDTLGIAALVERRPEELSGGQRQRVSVARALARDPRLVLLDEPFSALDSPVRTELRRQLRRLQREDGLSTVLVTHDPQEAAMLADEIVVIGDGRVLQAGPCGDVYRRPASLEVARVLGIDNLLAGIVESDGGLRVDGVRLPLPAPAPAGTRMLWRLAPEALALRDPRSGSVPLGTGTVLDLIDLGTVVEVLFVLADGPRLRARLLCDPGLGPGDRCPVHADPDGLHAWPGSA